MADPIDYQVGDTVKITPETLSLMQSSARSIKVSPSYEFVAAIEKVFKSGEPGVVTHRFRPGYEMSVDFGVQGRFHMKDSWVVRKEYPAELDPQGYLDAQADEIERLLAGGHPISNSVGGTMIGAVRNAAKFKSASHMSTEELMAELAKRDVAVLLTADIPSMAEEHEVDKDTVVEMLPRMRQALEHSSAPESVSTVAFNVLNTMKTEGPTTPSL